MLPNHDPPRGHRKVWGQVNRDSIAIIPARAGSIGLPGKNYALISGKPLVYWSLLAAYQSEVKTIALTTNCPHVKKIGEDFGTEFNCGSRLVIIDRPENLCAADASTEDAVKHALGQTGSSYEFVVLLQPTSPARKDSLIDACIRQLDCHSDFDAILTCSEHTPFFFNRFGKVLKPIDDNRRVPRQRLMPWQMYLHDNGNVYVTRMAAFMEYGRLGRQTMGHVVSNFESMQIDTKEDFVAMEALSGVFGGFL